MDDKKMLGEIAYNAYGDRGEWKTYDNKPMPTWSQLPLSTQIRWNSAVLAVLNEVIPPIDASEMVKSPSWEEYRKYVKELNALFSPGEGIRFASALEGWLWICGV